MKPCCRIWGLALLLSLFGMSGIHAQQRDLPGTIGSTREDSIPPGITPLDSAVTMTYVLMGDENTIYEEKDEFTWEDAHHEPPSFGQAHLGNLGSATRSLIAGETEPIGFSTGWFQYNPYYVFDETFRYYNQAVPAGRIKYSQAGQEDTYLTLDFGRSFSKGISLSIAYKRIHQIGEFAHQRQKDTGLGFGVWHNAPSGRYDAFYSFLSNAAYAEENGGVSAPELIGEPFYPDASIPVELTQGLTNHKHRSFMTRQILHLLPDSSSFGIDIWFRAKYQTGIYKFVDPNAAAQLDYYGSTYVTDDRGIRQFTFTREHEESVGVRLPWAAAHSTVDASLRYRNILLEQEPVKQNINELFLEAKGDFQWVDPLKLHGELSLGLGQAEGAYSFQASGELTLGELGKLQGVWSIFSRKPYMIESDLYVNQIQVYHRDLKNPFRNEIGVSWRMAKQDFEASVKWLVYDNLITFDTLAMPQQLTGSFSVRQISVSKGFDFRWWGMKAKGILQPGVKPEMAMPELAVAASLYARIHLFKKKVTLLPGGDLTYFREYPGVGYFPVNGVYHLTQQTLIPDYIRVDAGLGMRIQFLNLFVRMEDLGGLFQDRILYQAEVYPHYRGYFRIGIEAGFFN